MASIFLIGLMGSGKSFWAKQLSKTLNIPAFDLDNEIEKTEQKTISEIFAEHGQDYFRIKETEVLKAFAGKENYILSTGGGTPCFHDNMEWMNETGITIWIDEPLDTIEERLKKEKLHRPLIAAIPDNELKKFLSDMLLKRSAFYARSKFHLSSDAINESNFLQILSPNE